MDGRGAAEAQQGAERRRAKPSSQLGAAGRAPARRAARGVPGVLRTPDRALRALTPGWARPPGRCASDRALRTLALPSTRAGPAARPTGARPVPGQTLRAAPPSATVGRDRSLPLRGADRRHDDRAPARRANTLTCGNAWISA
ncbi:hypothetical protein GCM10017779_71090 [Streptomyces capillispiralis]|nr:hypothetical protein GCM10017779_71090 [Streptomyces capillispiralis]